jgi:hypothetical protein
LRKEFRVVFDADSFRKLAGKLLCDPQGTIRAAVIDQNIVPVLVGLPEHALNALCKIFSRVKERSYKTDARTF